MKGTKPRFIVIKAIIIISTRSTPGANPTVLRRLPLPPPPPPPPLPRRRGRKGGQGGGGDLLPNRRASHLQKTFHIPNITTTATDAWTMRLGFASTEDHSYTEHHRHCHRRMDHYLQTRTQDLIGIGLDFLPLSIFCLLPLVLPIPFTSSTSWARHK